MLVLMVMAFFKNNSYSETHGENISMCLFVRDSRKVSVLVYGSSGYGTVTRVKWRKGTKLFIQKTIHEGTVVD